METVSLILLYLWLISPFFIFSNRSQDSKETVNSLPSCELKIILPQNFLISIIRFWFLVESEMN